MKPPPIPPSAVRLKKARTLLGLSLAKVGRILDVSGQTFNNWERGITPISPRIAILIEKKIGIGKDYLLNGDEAMFVNSDEVDENFRRDNKLASDMLQKAMVFLPLLAPQIKSDTANSLTEYLEEANCLTFDGRWLESNFAPHPYKLCLFQIVGNHMEPTIQQGEIVFVNSGGFDGSIDDGVWLMKLGDHICVRRIQQIGIKQFQTSCDNPTFPPIPIDLNTSDDSFKLLGRVVGGSHKRY